MLKYLVLKKQRFRKEIFCFLFIILIVGLNGCGGKSSNSEKSKTSTGELQRILKEYEALDNQYNVYSVGSFENFTEALVNGRSISSSKNASDEEVETAIKDMKSAYENLVDLTELKNLIDKYGQLKNSDGDYTESSFSLFAKAIDEAKKILVDPNVTQNDVDAGINDINTAFDGLEEDAWTEPLSDKEKQQVIDKCITDYVFEEGKSFISSDVADWDIHIYPEYDNMIAARCNQPGKTEPGHKMAVAAFEIVNDTLIPKYENVNWGDLLLESEKDEKYIKWLEEIGYINEYGDPR